MQSSQNVLAVEEGNLILKDSDVLTEVQTGPNEFEKRKIRVGLSDGIHIEVLFGLALNDKIKVL